MDINQIISSTLVIDIETVSEYPEYDAMPERLKPLWDRKSQFLKNDDALNTKELYFERAGIYAEFGRIVCIAVGYFVRAEGNTTQLRVKSLHNDDERVVLDEFKELLSKFDEKKIVLVAHNGKEFDFPYICRRMLVKGIEIPECLNISGKKPWEVKHIDTMEMWKFGDWKSYTSLELLATIFDIDSSKSDIDGSQVNTYYYDKQELETIAEYCKADVVVTSQLFLKLNFLPLIENENIIIL